MTVNISRSNLSGTFFLQATIFITATQNKEQQRMRPDNDMIKAAPILSLSWLFYGDLVKCLLSTLGVPGSIPASGKYVFRDPCLILSPSVLGIC